MLDTPPTYPTYTFHTKPVANLHAARVTMVADRHDAANTFMATKKSQYRLPDVTECKVGRNESMAGFSNLHPSHTAFLTIRTENFESVRLSRLAWIV